MAVGGHGCQRELLRRHGLFQVQHQAHRARLVLADPNASDERVVGLHLADQLAQRGAELQPVDIHHQTRRVVGAEVAGRQRGVGFECQPGVVGRRPKPHRDDAGAKGDVRIAKQQRQAAQALQGAATRWRVWPHPDSATPSGLSAWTMTARASSVGPGDISMRKSGGGNQSPALSGHSAIFRPGAA